MVFTYLPTYITTWILYRFYNLNSKYMPLNEGRLKIVHFEVINGRAIFSNVGETVY